MGSVTTTCCFLHSPFFPTPSSQCSFNPPLLFSSLKTAPRRNIRAMASPDQTNPRDSSSCARRLILFVGFAVIPLLNTGPEAIEGLTAVIRKKTFFRQVGRPQLQRHGKKVEVANREDSTQFDPLKLPQFKEDSELRAQDQKEKAKQPVQESSSQNTSFSFLNILGVLGSGVLAVLYVSTKKEKAISDATIESMSIELKEKEAASTSIAEKVEAELLNEKEIRKKTLAEANEELQSLVNKLKLAEDTISSLERELQKEKKSVKELTIQADHLEVSLREAENDKRELQEQLKEKIESLAVFQERINLLSSEIEVKEDSLGQLDSELADKEQELSRLSFVYQQSVDQLTSLNTEIRQLKDLLLKNERELDLKNEMFRKLKIELTSSRLQKDESSKKVDAILKDYNQFKSFAEKTLTSDAKLLGELEKKIRQLEEQLKFSVDEVKKNIGLISDLIQEKDNLIEMLNTELKNVKNLAHELKTTQDTLEKSRDKASDLAKQLQQSKQLCSELKTEISKVRAEFSEARESLLRNVDEEERGAEVLAGELRSTKELLSKSNEELQISSQELSAALQKCENLENKLVYAHEKSESAVVDLKGEKNIVSSLNKELKVLESQFSKDIEARKSLESDLEEASKSLHEMNRKASMLSRDIELTNSQISGLQDNKEALHKSIDEQKQISREACENLEDGHNLVMRLRNVRESLVKRGKKLEEEVASAKGEILRLKSQINSSETPLNQQKLEVGEEGKAAVPTRKITWRRKVTPQQEDS